MTSENRLTEFAKSDGVGLNFDAPITHDLSAMMRALSMAAGVPYRDGLNVGQALEQIEKLRDRIAYQTMP